jgi:hypothetical protein
MPYCSERILTPRSRAPVSPRRPDLRPGPQRARVRGRAGYSRESCRCAVARARRRSRTGHRPAKSAQFRSRRFGLELGRAGLPGSMGRISRRPVESLLRAVAEEAATRDRALGLKPSTTDDANNDRWSEDLKRPAAFTFGVGEGAPDNTATTNEQCRTDRGGAQLRRKTAVYQGGRNTTCGSDEFKSHRYRHEKPC